MNNQDANIFLANKILQTVKLRIEFNLDNFLSPIKDEFKEDNQRILTDKTEFSHEEKEFFNTIQNIPNYQVRNFLIEEDYIKETKSTNFYKLTKLGREIKSAGSISNYERHKSAVTHQIELDNRQARLNQKLLVCGAVGAALGALGLVIWEVFVFFWEHCHK